MYFGVLWETAIRISVKAIQQRLWHVQYYDITQEYKASKQNWTMSRLTVALRGREQSQYILPRVLVHTHTKNM